MSAREHDALEALRGAERLLIEHRHFVRGRPRSEANDDEHERVTQALHRSREAIAHLEPLPEVQRIDALNRRVLRAAFPRCPRCGEAREENGYCVRCGK